MNRSPYKAKSLSGAQAKVRCLLKQREFHMELLERFAAERKILAMLAADGPAFDNPLVAANAKNVRNGILAGMGMNPDGSFKKRGSI